MTSSSTPWCGSTLPARRATTATAASCSTCCAACSTEPAYPYSAFANGWIARCGWYTAIPSVRDLIDLEVIMSVEHVETLIIGAGQSGLATAHHLQLSNRPFLVVDANARVGDGWRR